MDKKYFFFDIDGTLASGVPGQQHIPKSTKVALEKLKENGHFVAIATGRSYAMAKQFMDEFDIDNMVHDGGNGVTINRDMKGIEPLDYEACCRLIDECIEKDIPWAFSPDNEQRRLCPDNRFYDFTHDTYMKCEVVEGLNPRNYDQIFKVYVACFNPEEDYIESLKDLPWCRYHKEYFFVEPLNKAKGIRKIVDHFNGEYKDVVTFGDSLNDVSMFLKDEWTCIAMGNACDELKEIASDVTTDIDDDGIYNACVKYGWIEDER